jgi:hypothetical protein
MRILVAQLHTAVHAPLHSTWVGVGVVTRRDGALVLVLKTTHSFAGAGLTLAAEQVAIDDADLVANSEDVERTPSARRGPLEPLRTDTGVLLLRTAEGNGRIELLRTMPRIVMVHRQLGHGEIDCELDAAWLDAASARCVFRWRAVLDPGGARADLERVIVAFEEAASRDLADLARNLAHASWGFAAERGVCPPAPADADESDALQMARFEAAAGSAAADPSIDVERYARISGELARGEPRHTVLDRHGFDELAWMVEERSWLDTLARDASRGDGSLALRLDALRSSIAAPKEGLQ